MSSASERNRNRIEEIFVYGLDTEHFMVYLQGVEESPYEEDGEFIEPGIEYRMANRLIKGLDVLSGMDCERPITISMKTGGGFVSEGMAMYDAIMSTPNPISIVSYTEASSMSSIVLQAANKRILMPSSMVMLHEGETGIHGNRKVVNAAHEYSKHETELMFDIYVNRIKHGGKSWSKKRIRQWLIDEMKDKEDVYFTAPQAVKAGLADEVFTDWDSVINYTEEQKSWKQ